jgi:CRISPR associated protein Cas1
VVASHAGEATTALSDCSQVVGRLREFVPRGWRGHGRERVDGAESVETVEVQTALAERVELRPHRRTRTLPRAQRTVRRIVILGHTGTVTLDAIRWCADVGVALIQIDSDGRVLMVGNNPARTDSRLLRAQAAAASSEVGVAIARQLLGAKVDGQAEIAHHELANPETATAVRRLGADLQHATDLRGCRDLESQAANAYFAAWTTVGCQFTKQSQSRVPSHWHQYTVRSCPAPSQHRLKR